MRGHGVGDQDGPVEGGELALPARHGVGLGVLGPHVMLDGGLIGFQSIGIFATLF